MAVRNLAPRSCVVDPTGIGGRLLNLGRLAGTGRAGIDVASELMQQAADAGVDVHYELATEVTTDPSGTTVTCGGRSFSARAVVLATGFTNGTLGLTDENELYGRGLS